MKRLFIAGTALVGFSSAAHASCGLGQTACPVPEISALEGTAAIAALAAIVLLAWERRRRAA